MSRSSSSCETVGRGKSPKSFGTAVSLADVLELRNGAKLRETETWAILCQAVQALQDLFLNDDNISLSKNVLPAVSTSSLVLTARGRVVLLPCATRAPKTLCTKNNTSPTVQSVNISNERRQQEIQALETGCIAPEYRNNGNTTEAEIEKMWIYSLGMTLKQTLTNHQNQIILPGLLESMTKQDVHSRASLMYLLDVITEYCRSHSQMKPFSHEVISLYQEVLGEPQPNKICLYDEDKIKKEPKSDTDSGRSSAVLTGHYSNLTSTNSINNDNNFETSDDSRRNYRNQNKITREASTCTDIALISKKSPKNSTSGLSKAASTLPRLTGTKRNQTVNDEDEEKLIGPEFIYRSRKPCMNLIIADCKASVKRQVTVILLNGQKLDITCDPNHTTAGDIFQALVQSENLDENYMLGLCVMLAGDFIFLPDDCKIYKIAPAGWNTSNKLKKSSNVKLTLLLFLRFKFFLPSFRSIKSFEMRHLLYLQLRRSILEQQLFSSLEQIISISGFAMQAEFGNYNEKEHGQSDYFLLEHYIPENYIMTHDELTLKQKLQSAHQQKHGLYAEKAEECFIIQAQSMKDYGAHFYTAIWVTKTGFDRDVWLSITSQGITLEERFSMCQKVDTKERNILEVFHWKGIQTLCYSKHYLSVIPQSKINGKKAKKYKFRMENKKSYYAFHLASIHHQFFLRLRNSNTSIRILSNEFGIPLRDIKNENNRLYKIQSVSNNNLYKSNEPLKPMHFKVISQEIKGEELFENNEKEFKNRLRNKLKKRSKSTTDIRLIGKELRLEEFQNKENENPLYDNFDHDLNASKQSMNFILGENAPSLPRRLGVKMGTRAFSGAIHKEQFLSLDEINTSLIESDSRHRECISIEPHLMSQNYIGLLKRPEDNLPESEVPILNDELDRLSLRSISLHSMGFQSDKNGSDTSPAPEAYVIHSSIKQLDDRYITDFQESISASLMEKLNNISFEEERILTTVKISRDLKESLGMQIAEGSDGNVYVQNVIINGSAYKTGRIHNGDHIIAVNGLSLINRPYKESLKLLQNGGLVVELTLSQIYEQRPDSLLLKSKNYKQTPLKKQMVQKTEDLYKSCLTNIAQNKINSKNNKSENIYTNDFKNLQNIKDNSKCNNSNLISEVEKIDKQFKLSKTVSMPQLLESQNIKFSNDKRKALMNKIALPKSLSLSRKWLGPVRYPVTPSKDISNPKLKLSLRHVNLQNVSMNVDGSFADSMISDDEQVFI